MPESIPLVTGWSVVHLNRIVVVPGFGAQAGWPLGGVKYFAGGSSARRDGLDVIRLDGLGVPLALV
jgi:hypothetical protein